jgi:hypothetical protein
MRATAEPTGRLFTAPSELHQADSGVAGLNLTYGVYCRRQSALSHIVLPLTNHSTEIWEVVLGIECTK